MIILNVVLKPVGGPTTACTRLDYATPSRSFVQFQRVFPTKESLVYRRAGEAIRHPLFQSVIISFPNNIGVNISRCYSHPLSRGLLPEVFMETFYIR